MKKNNLNPKPIRVKNVEKALRLAALRAAGEHRQTGNPLIVWRGGKILKIHAVILILIALSACHKIVAPENSNHRLGNIGATRK